MLRLGTINDYAKLHDIYMDERVHQYLNFDEISSEEFHSYFNQFIANEQLFVYEIDHNVVASCIVTKQKRLCAHIATLGTVAVDPAMQGKGMGRQFIKSLINKLFEEGIQRIDFLVKANNYDGMKFYLKMGFKMEGHLKNYFKRPASNEFIDAYLLALT